MKVLYISHFKESSGWGQAARDYILALDKVGVDVVPKSITLGNPTAQLSDRLQFLEQKSSQNCDICIQHILPHYMKYDGHFRKNVGLFVLETSHIKHTSWPKHLNLMDELWVPCNHIIRNTENNGIKKPVKLVPHTFDTSIYDLEYPIVNLPTKGKFVFYFIGEYGRRKHLSALIKAFHTEFRLEEPVELVLKVNRFGLKSSDLIKEIQGYSNQIKDGLKLYKDPQRYKPEIIITDNISRQDILRLHATCDCFVMPSYGDAWNIPAFEAMAMGNLVITSATGGMLDYIRTGKNGFLVTGKTEIVFGQNDTFEDFGTSRERWFDISTVDLMKTMRHVYEMSNDQKQKIKEKAKASSKNYDYNKIGQKMKELLSV